MGTMPAATAAAAPPEEPPGECPRSQGFLHGPRSRDSVVLEAFRTAVEELKRRSPRSYEWGFAAPMNERFAPLPAVPQQNRGTYIQIVELGQAVRAISILPPGQSEDPKSPHYSDQLNLSSWWKFKPLITDRTALPN
jgi:penicillin amidase